MARNRASMREGPLAELFRATEAAQRSASGERRRSRRADAEDAGRAGRAGAAAAAPDAAAAREPEVAAPTEPDRLPSPSRTAGALARAACPANPARLERAPREHVVPRGDPRRRRRRRRA